MIGYWIRHRLFLTLFMGILFAIVSVCLFIYPYMKHKADSYNSQSLYKNTDIDFIAPEPSYEQISELPGTHGINKVFPFYLTKTTVSVGETSYSSTILMSDQIQNIDFTMYNDLRLVEKATTNYENPIIADWEFCKNASVKIGDLVSFSMNGEKKNYRINAIYETNSIYEGGTLLVPINEVQKEKIRSNAGNNGYSAMYISASDYEECKSFLMSDYRPLGRLKKQEQFDSYEQYKVHYDAIMSSGFANEITDFKIRESSLELNNNPLLVYIGAIITLIIVIGFNVAMSKRGCEKVYFKKHCIPRGLKVKTYYKITFLIESITFVALYFSGLFIRVKYSNVYMGKTISDIRILLIPLTVLLTEIICIGINFISISFDSNNGKRIND